MLEEFKEFIKKGNIVELAVAFIIGVEIAKVITSLVDDVIMRIIGIVVGKPSFDVLTLKIGDGVIAYGSFLTALINFLIIAFVVFLMLKAYNKMKGTKPEEAAEPDEVQLLTEIRDALRNRP